MLIEYKFRFEKNGLTLTQRIESSVSDPHSSGGEVIDSNSLKGSYQESKPADAHQGPRSGGGPNGKTGPGGKGGPTDIGTAPIIIIGPFIMCCPHEEPKKKEGQE